MKFDYKTLEYKLKFEEYSEYSTIQSKITEIYVPNYHYGCLQNFAVVVSDGSWTYDKENQTIYWKFDHNKDPLIKSHSFKIKPVNKKLYTIY